MPLAGVAVRLRALRLTAFGVGGRQPKRSDRLASGADNKRSEAAGDSKRDEPFDVGASR